jgi:2-deoxystreptamine N-acetyl-D-glucosaminyltransferase/2-deoxystreptamine glucosyltransferase
MDLNISWALGVVREVLSDRPTCDIVHVHCSGVFWPLLVGMVAAPLLKARLILTVHCSILATYHAMHALDQALQPVARKIECMALRRADHTVVLSPHVRQILLEKTNIAPAAVSIVPDSLDVDVFRGWATAEAISDIRRRFNLPASCPVITYVGRIAREKGWRRLVEIAERLKHRPFHFLICGDGNERDLLEAEIERRGLSQFFTITGYLPQEIIPATLANSSVLVLPSTHEEFGGVLIEAMVMQVPPVAFAVGGIPNTVQDGRTGLLVPAGDVAAMARAIESLLDNSALCKRLGDGGLAHVQHNFTLDAACRGLYEIYRTINPS